MWTSEPIDVAAMRAHIATLEAQLAATCRREADSCKRHDDRVAALEAQLMRDTNAELIDQQQADREKIATLEAQLAAAFDLAAAVDAMLTTSGVGNYDRIVATLAAYRAIRGGEK